MDVLGTSHRPDGPWPADDHPVLAAWLKLESLEKLGKKHDSSVSFLEDSVKRTTLTVVRPYSKNSTRIEVEGLSAIDLSDASESTPVVLIDTNNPTSKLFVIGTTQHLLRTLPSAEEGHMRQSLIEVKADSMQAMSGHHPFYRRNVRNFMPSLRFTPCQFLNFVEHSCLQRKLSGPVTQKDFTLFFVAKGYRTMGSSPWPVFTALDGKTAYSYQLQVVIEQEAGKEDSFEARWKIMCGGASAKTSGIDPTQFSVICVAKVGRLVRLFVNGSESRRAAAELAVEDEDDCVANISEVSCVQEISCQRVLTSWQDMAGYMFYFECENCFVKFGVHSASPKKLFRTK